MKRSILLTFVALALTRGLEVRTQEPSRALTPVTDAMLRKPDPAIFVYAAAALGVRPSDAMMVGDSVDRDMRPAKSLGMTTAWLEGPVARTCADPGLIDVRLRSIAELPAALQRLVSA